MGKNLESILVLQQLELVRGGITEQREKMRRRTMNQSLNKVRKRHVRPVWHWLQRDKLSSQWLLALPSPGSDLFSAEFEEAFAAPLICS